MSLNLLWFCLLGVLMAGYGILDGFDLGVGMLHPLGKDDRERRLIINSIGPLWDGNEVWLVTFGGALFAAFPEAYAAVFSAFYDAFMALLFALIFRAVSLEFRGKMGNPLWRRVWDWGFFLSSLLATVLFGVAVGSAVGGLPLDVRGQFTGHFLALIRPYAVLTGVMTMAMFLMHGSIYLYLRTDGELQQRVHRWVWRGFGFFLIMYMFTTIYTLVALPHVVAGFKAHPWTWVVPALTVLAVANIPRAVYKGQPLYAFISSSATIAAMVFLFGVALYPNMVLATNPAHSLTIYNAASSHRTLVLMTIIAAVGLPFVLTYTTLVYWTFRGKVTLGEHSY